MDTDKDGVEEEKAGAEEAGGALVTAQGTVLDMARGMVQAMAQGGVLNPCRGEVLGVRQYRVICHE
jgi:hypothetical protein